MEPGQVASRVFHLPRSAYLAVLFLLFCTAPVAFASSGADPVYSWRALFMLIPILAAVFIARTATLVDASGIRVRAAFGSRFLPWASVRGLNVEDRAIYAVVADGAVRLPCVGVADLALVSQLSDGALPPVAEPTRKYAPGRKSRR